eukprot:EG_transcript_942
MFAACLLCLLWTSGAAATLQLDGAGSTLAYPVYTAAALAYSFAQANVSVRYAGTGSGGGLCRLKDAALCPPAALAPPLNIDFAGSDALLTDSDYSQFPDLQMYPTMAAAVVPIFNLGPVTNLTLSTGLLAQIFAGTVRFWDDARILNLNPQLNGVIPARQPITLVVRSDSSGTTQIFKKALAKFDPSFQAQIGTASSNSWVNVTTTQRSGNQGVVAYVMATAFTLGYSELSVAVTNKLPTVRLQKANGSTVTASTTTTAYAVLELGLSFGNNGDLPARLTADLPARLTADLQAAQGANAWPIVGYSYLVMRKSTLRAGATCANVRATVDFWYWFWTSDVAARVLEDQSFSSLPSVVLDVVLRRFMDDIMCGGQPVYQSEVLVPLTGQGTELLTGLFSTLDHVYRLADATANLTYNEIVSADADTDLATTMFGASTDPSLPAPPDGFKLTFAGAGLAIVAQVNLTLDGLMLARILQGDITTWLHPALLALNPDGIRDARGAVITNASLPIQLLRGPIATKSSLTSLMAHFLPAYSGTALLAAPISASEDILRYRVLGNPLSLAVTPYGGAFPSGLLLAPYRRADGSAISPSWQAIKACTSDTFDASQTSFQLHVSSSPSCYPLALPVHLRVRKSKCDAVNDAARTSAVAFIEWMFSNAALPNALQAAGLAPLADAHPLATAANQAALAAISCAPRATASSSGFPLVIIIGMCVAGGVVFLIIPAVVWHSTRRMRALHKQFSNDNVAQECAAAIARFDLDAVVWLNDLKSPNKIQMSFIQIVHLLTEVKPFIPDQLLHQLTGQGETLSDQDREEPSPENKAPRLRLAPRGSTISAAYHSQRKHSECPTRTEVASSVHSASDGEPTPKARRGTRPLLASPRQRPAMQARPSVAAALPTEAEVKWTRKRCAWLHAELRSSGSLDDPTTLSELSAVVTILVAVAKKHGATIERVGVETVIVHWGLAGHVAQAAHRAAFAALEMAAAARPRPAGPRGPVQLRVGVMYGWGHIGTLSAAGHRFFVSVGTEMAAAAELVQDSVFEQCRCTVLMSPAVQQEVQYNVKCLPRALFASVVLWQPVELLSSKETDEWMYELQKMEAGDGARVAKDRALGELFALAASGASPIVTHRAVKALRQQHGPSLAVEDVASLDLLVASLEQQAAAAPSLSVTCVEEDLT